VDSIKQKLSSNPGASTLSRKQMLVRAGKKAAKYTLFFAPFGLSGLFPDKAQGGIKKMEISRLLNVALQMEFVLKDFYQLARDNKNLVPSPYSKSINETYGHHLNHLLMLKNRIFSVHEDAENVTSHVKAKFNIGDLKPKKDFDDFLQLGQVLEDAAAALYKKIAPKVRDNNGSSKLQRYLLQSHTTEARHAGYLRMIRAERGIENLSPWPSAANNKVLPELQEIYENEDNYIQNDIDLSEITALPLPVIKEAWDEPCRNDAFDNLFLALKVTFY